MRLIDVKDLSMHEFDDSTVPEYAILSHRWEEGELSFKDLQDRTNLRKAGWGKLQSFRKFAQDRGHQYFWIDTCSIDKSSSSELSEAINSMFSWYSKASVCYAYLFDVPRKSTYYLGDKAWTVKFKKSEWFERAWTLQELLAPRRVIFVSQDWAEELGTKESLSREIHETTLIPESQVRFYYGSIVARPDYSNAASIAEIMSWASRRSCTRIEDSAYSLMGLFGIAMPLIYGEGRAAFLRLQLEIINRSDDETIFAWNGSSNYGGMLAMSVDYFQNCLGKDMQPSNWDSKRPPYTMTNKGLRMEPLICPLDTSKSDPWKWLMPLNVNSTSSSGFALRIAINDDEITADRNAWDSLVPYDLKTLDKVFERRILIFKQRWQMVNS